MYCVHFTIKCMDCLDFYSFHFNIVFLRIAPHFLSVIHGREQNAFGQRKKSRTYKFRSSWYVKIINDLNHEFWRLKFLISLNFWSSLLSIFAIENLMFMRCCCFNHLSVLYFSMIITMWGCLCPRRWHLPISMIISIIRSWKICARVLELSKKCRYFTILRRKSILELAGWAFPQCRSSVDLYNLSDGSLIFF